MSGSFGERSFQELLGAGVDVEFKPHADPEGAFAHVGELLGRTPPAPLLDFYRTGIVRIEDFRAFVPRWNAYRGWRPDDDLMVSLAVRRCGPALQRWMPQRLRARCHARLG